MYKVNKKQKEALRNLMDEKGKEENLQISTFSITEKTIKISYIFESAKYDLSFTKSGNFSSVIKSKKISKINQIEDKVTQDFVNDTLGILEVLKKD